LELKKYLQGKGIKITKARMSILDILSKADDAVNVELIFNECKRKNINIDLSTVYRSLELFENKGIIRKFDLGQGKYSYTIKKENHKHILECRFCHREVEIDCPMQQIKEIIKNKTGFTFLDEEPDLKLEGICKQCSQGDKLSLKEKEKE
jgi:Fe2+ or Zn2+ uptake regulation protein